MTMGYENQLGTSVAVPLLCPKWVILGLIRGLGGLIGIFSEIPT